MILNNPCEQRPRPTVTIALPVFNGGAQLREAVSSLLSQTFQEWELLIIDDGSTDGAIDQLERLQDTRVRVIRDGQNHGLARRLNEAIQLANGEFFARMDHDDICHPQRLAKQVQYLQTNPQVDLLATRCVTIDELNHLTGVLPSEFGHQSICRRPWIGIRMAHPSWMGRTEWFRRHRYADPAPYCAEDQELLLRAASVSQYQTLKDYLLAYRVRAHTPWKKQYRTRFSLAKVQMACFFSSRQFHFVTLSFAALVARLGLDLVHRLRKSSVKVSVSVPRPGLPQSVKDNWLAILNRGDQPDLGGA